MRARLPIPVRAGAHGNCLRHAKDHEGGPHARTSEPRHQHPVGDLRGISFVCRRKDTRPRPRSTTAAGHAPVRGLSRGGRGDVRHHRHASHSFGLRALARRCPSPSPSLRSRQVLRRSGSERTVADTMTCCSSTNSHRRLRSRSDITFSS